jgi:hypothetical protein
MVRRRKPDPALDDEPLEGQEEMFDSDSVDEVAEPQRPDSFEYNLTLRVKGVQGDKSQHIIPVCRGSIFGNRIEEMLGLALGSKYFRDRLRAVVGKPLTPKS